MRLGPRNRLPTAAAVPAEETGPDVAQQSAAVALHLLAAEVRVEQLAYAAPPPRGGGEDQRHRHIAVGDAVEALAESAEAVRTQGEGLPPLAQSGGGARHGANDMVGRLTEVYLRERDDDADLVEGVLGGEVLEREELHEHPHRLSRREPQQCELVVQGGGGQEHCLGDVSGVGANEDQQVVDAVLPWHAYESTGRRDGVFAAILVVLTEDGLAGLDAEPELLRGNKEGVALRHRGRRSVLSDPYLVREADDRLHDEDEILDMR